MELEAGAPRVLGALRLNLPRRHKKRVLTRPRGGAGCAADDPGTLTLALDFMGDTLYNRRCYRTLNVLDEGNREGLAIEIDTSLPSGRVIALLDQLVAIHGTPGRLRCDNGPEFIADRAGGMGVRFTAASRCSTSNQGSRTRTPSSSASTRRTSAWKCSTRGLHVAGRSTAGRRRSGWRCTTPSGHIAVSGRVPPSDLLAERDRGVSGAFYLRTVSLTGNHTLLPRRLDLLVRIGEKIELIP